MFLPRLSRWPRHEPQVGGSRLRSQSTPYVSPRRHSRPPGSATSRGKVDRHGVMNSPTEVDIISFGGNQRDQCDGCSLN
jgi:hypothetical protein